MVYAIKAAAVDLKASVLEFAAQKTMYGGKRIAPGDKLFIFASETQGGQGLVACGIVATVKALPKQLAGQRETPRVSLSVGRLRRATRALGRSDLKPFTRWTDGQPQTELNFKFYRQATNKIVGLSDRTAAFLEEFF